MPEIKQCILTNNDCYKVGKKHTVKGIMWHSSGANNPYLSRYLAPDDGVIGQNKYSNHWNQPRVSKCAHAMIGKDKNGIVRVYQTLPWDMAGWHSGTGSKGKNLNANNTGYIGFETLEDDLTDEKYFNEVYEKGIELCVFLCKKFNLTEKNIIGHYEGYQMGIASNHGDPKNWLSKFGKSMDTIREDVKKLLQQESGKEENKSMTTYTVQTGDTLIKIAQRHNTTLEEILKVNPQIKNPSLIRKGDVINIPTKEELKTDYKALYEAEQKKTADLESKVKDLNNKLQTAEGEIKILEAKINNAISALK